MTIHNGNIERIESLITRLQEIGPQVTGGVFASISWSYAVSLANVLALLARLDDSTDYEFGGLSAAAREDRRARYNVRYMEICDILSWAASYASDDILPTGEQIAALVLNDEQAVTMHTAEQIKLVAELLGIDEAQARSAAAVDMKERQQRARLQARALAAKRKELVALIDRTLDEEPSPEFQLSLQDALRIAERIAERCERYEQQRVSRAFATRRTRVLARLAAERRLLAEVMNAADALAERFQAELDAAPEYAELSTARTERGASAEVAEDNSEAVAA